MRGFLLILFAGLGCAVLGGALGWLLGAISPEFVALVAQPHGVAEPARLGAALGTVSGLLLGFAAMVVGLLLGAFRAWLARGHSQINETLASPDKTPDVLAGRAAADVYDYSEKGTR